MTILNFISMAGGVAMFLYGMSIMGTGLEKVSGGHLERALERMTNNIFLSVLLGAAATALIQSSSATTVIVVGLVNAGVMKLKQAVGVIMGANIGTTITAQLIRLSDIESDSLILSFFKPKTLAPLAATIGIVMFMASKKTKRKEIGQMLVGFGVLFAGMFAMEEAVAPLQTSPVFPKILGAMSNPILGVLAGAVITALIQSSAASIGMLQALSSTGLLTFSTAFPIIMGQNIGTCITPILSSIGASKNAKRSALIHLYFNLIGTILFLLVMYGIKYTVGISFWESSVTRTTIANFHTFFNITVTLALIPFASLIEKLARASIKDPKEGQNDLEKMLDTRLLKSPSIAIQQSNRVVDLMVEGCLLNFKRARDLFDKYDTKLVERLNETEDTIDKMEDKLENYLIKVSACEISSKENLYVSEMFHLIKDYERIGDYIVNLAECAQEMDSNHIKFSSQAEKELDILCSAVREIVEISAEAFDKMNIDIARQIEPLEETIDAMVEKLKDCHVGRLKSGLCNVHAGIMYLEILTNLERVSDHCSNIAIHILTICEGKGRYDAHEYIKKTHNTPDALYTELMEGYMDKYFDKINTYTEEE